ncbi:MAG TPA: hypothetical protein VM915_13315 [Verrucomicrobiae bacterium]|nr:hypothetical protein [Verrucomicrobiae bacterium]
MSNQIDRRERLAWPGPLTVRTVLDARRAVLAAFEGCDCVDFELSADADIDLAALQFLHSVRLEAARTAKTFRLIASAGGRLQQVLQEAGFGSVMNADDRTFWSYQGAA